MSEQSDRDVLAGLLGKFIEDGGYFCWGVKNGSGFLTIDNTISLTIDEVEAITRATGVDGQAWWQKSMGTLSAARNEAD